MLNYYLKRAKQKATARNFEFPQLTGKATLIIGLEGYGPMMIRVDDRHLTAQLIGAVLTKMDAHPDATNIQEYQNSEEYLARQLL